MTRAFVCLVGALLLAACGGPAGAASRGGPEETTEQWTSGDDEALGIASPPESE